MYHLCMGVYASYIYGIYIQYIYSIYIYGIIYIFQFQQYLVAEFNRSPMWGQIMALKGASDR